MTSALTFQNNHFDVIEQSNQIWLTASQIGTALGYAREDSVSRIYDRNRDEFSSGMSMTVNLTVNGINNSLREKTVRIFSLRGAHLIAMFARTSIAKQFRKWVLDVLDSETKTQTIIPISNPAQIPHANWPITYRTEWKHANLAVSPKQAAQYIRFELQPKPFSSEFSAKHTPQIYQAIFYFADNHQKLINLRQNITPQIGDFGYFESTNIEDLWIQVTSFAARCHSGCVFI
ncbi:BRO-N domain-containing protein [Vibrio aestuarianus]|uniref:BRO family, N-domain protein n=1 Tax=Vibrio aestuarianus TaxID=28171 RepID=A0ABM9FR55_9VIBR|nr:BRO family protein [Vibrio aestuarianus]MDE1213777.1 hypothetical protein [Vibrio aestuarianus]MDE1217234.1 hypothetical protein [Vibrio aestuarianus]MDE1256974.1 hypothetical protein [Vibrio aestuarianus]MDE1260775.1 hypothetical protein [Vibrio aestuarianus]MDE1267571.1 hypothetical protein [Vibrio aestuarianus]